MPLTLTYEGNLLTDGLGSQLHRMYGVYCASKFYRVGYKHSGLSKVTLYSFDSLVMRESTSEELGLINSTFDIPSEPAEEYDRIESKYDIFPHELLAISERANRESVLLRLVMPFGLTDRQPEIFGAAQAISPFRAKGNGAVQVAVHVRRGELPFIAPSRVTPNEYFVRVIGRIATVLKAMHVPFSISVFTERTPWDDEPIMPHMFGDTSVEIIANSDQMAPLRRMAEADILVMSHSAYSYSAALLNRGGVILYNSFWHPPLPSWIKAGRDGWFDTAAVVNLVTSILRSRLAK